MRPSRFQNRPRNPLRSVIFRCPPDLPANHRYLHARFVDATGDFPSPLEIDAPVIFRADTPRTRQNR
jgi:hypothetical protein